MIKAILMDFNGVIIDDEQIQLDVIRDLLKATFEGTHMRPRYEAQRKLYLAKLLFDIDHSRAVRDGPKHRARFEQIVKDALLSGIAPAGAAEGLESDFRPHFFGGVATVVAKLLVQCAPDVAVFGEKDYQQLKVISRLAADLDLPVKIVGAPIVREKSGLALSSRNAYLTDAQRGVAATLNRVLKDCARRIAGKEHIARVLDEGSAEIENVGFTIDYLEARHANSLAKVETLKDGPIRLLVAARLGATRLIDNVAV
mgnify:CR=1 FL=1